MLPQPRHRVFRRRAPRERAPRLGPRGRVALSLEHRFDDSTLWEESLGFTAAVEDGRAIIFLNAQKRTFA